MTVAAFSLRRAVAADAPAMWAIRAQAIRETCRSHYPAELLDRWACSPLPETFPARIENEYFVVGTAGSRVAGFGALNISNGEIEAVFVAPEAGRRGLGRSLLAALEKAAVDAGLKMISLGSSLNAVPFYQAAGYHAGERGTYTTSQGVEIACVRMSKPLDDIPGR
jgi:GNAT superfamily N-acetyltransferase